MATAPGLLTDWPWKPLGRFKYAVLSPWVVHSTYNFLFGGEKRNTYYFFIFPLLVSRALHNLIWISYSRYRTAKGRRRIVDRGIEFEQVDRESGWDDQIIFNGVLMYLLYWLAYPFLISFPAWNLRGVILTMVLHAGPVEFIYYWLHRALHHHFLYSRYHSHHHSSIVTEPITSVTHPFAEHISYFLLFAIPIVTTVLTNTASVASICGYISYIDFMNNLGHCNFELVPTSLFAAFPPLKLLFYTPSYHSLHHTKFRTNYSLFMPFYDYLYNTVDKSSDNLHESSWRRPEESPDVVNLEHLTSSLSICHLQVGFASFASQPLSSKWYLRAASIFTFPIGVLVTTFGKTFASERFTFKNLKYQTWVVPKFTKQYSRRRQSIAINKLIEDAIVEADRKGVKVLSLGLMNQAEDINKNGGLYLEKMPNLKVKIVDGSSLAVAVILNSIPQGTTKVVISGSPTKVARNVAAALIQKTIQVTTLNKQEYKKFGLNSIMDRRDIASDHTVWLVGDETKDEDQKMAPKGTTFIPFSHFPVKKLRRDCSYLTTPAMRVPKEFENLNSCENWLPRNVMSAWRISGLVHALEGWKENEVGYSMLQVDNVWEAALRHGFRPLNFASSGGNGF